MKPCLAAKNMRRGFIARLAIGTSLKFRTTASKFNGRRRSFRSTLAKRMGLPLVATSDAHYVRREDAVAQDVLLCINTGKFRTDTNRMRMEGDQFFLRSPEEMYAAFPGLKTRSRAVSKLPTASISNLSSASGTFRRSRRRRAKRRRLICANLRERDCASATPTIRNDGKTAIRNRANLARKCGSGSSASSASSISSASAITSSSCGTLCGTRPSRTSPARRAVRASGRSCATRSRSATFARCTMVCCSSGFWTRTAAKRPISTSTSARIAVAKSFSM